MTRSSNERLFNVLSHYWVAGISVVATIALSDRSDIAFSFQSGVIAAFQTVLVLGVTVFWFISFVHATLHELELLKSFRVTPVIAESNMFSFAAVLFISILFGLLITSPTNLLDYSIIGLILLWIIAIGYSIVLRSVANEYLKSSSRQKKLKPLVEYYLFRPFFLHQIWWVTGFFLALIFSVISSFENEPRFSWVATIAIVVTILVGELVIYKWRKSRDIKILIG